MKSSAKITKKAAKEASAKAKGSESASAQKAGSKKSQKKSSPGSKKGEVVVVGGNDSEDDSLDLANMERMNEEMDLIRREDRTKKPLVISLSAALANVAAGFLVYVCCFPRAGSVFYAKAGFFKRLIKLACQRRKLVNPGEDSTPQVHPSDPGEGLGSNPKQAFP